jgi:virginiamycin B lyase
VIPVQGPMNMVADGPVLWVMAPGRLDRLDPVTNAVTGSVALGPASDQDQGLAAGAAGLWATSWSPSFLYRVDPATRRIVAKVPVGLAAKGVLAGAGGVWVADAHGGTVLRIDPATNRIVATITVGPAAPSGPNWLAGGLGSIWVDVPNSGTIVRIDAITNRVQAVIPTPDGFSPCGGLAVGSAAVWVTSCSAQTAMTRIEPASNTVVATVNLGGHGYNPTLINDAPWISVDTGNADTGMLVRIDPATNSIDRVLVPGAPFGGGGDIVVAGGSAWVVDGYNNAVIRLPLAAFAP